jgi:hypothetical protein
MNKKFFAIAALGLTLGGCNATVYSNEYYRRPIASVYVPTAPVYVPPRSYYVQRHTYNPYIYRPYRVYRQNYYRPYRY